MARARAVPAETLAMPRLVSPLVHEQFLVEPFEELPVVPSEQVDVLHQHADG